MGRSLFRKTALDHLASPEQLDQLLQITSAKSWLALLALAMLLIAILVWSIVGVIPITVAGTGVIRPATDGKVEAVVYVSLNDGSMIQPGMDAKLALSSVKQEQYGLLLGKVSAVGDLPASEQEMLRALGNESLAQKLIADGSLIEIRIAILSDSTSETGYRWSTGTGPPIKHLRLPSLCQGSIIIEERRPISLIMP